MNKPEIPKYSFNFAPDVKTIEFTSFKSGKVQRHMTKLIGILTVTIELCLKIPHYDYPI